MLSGHPQYPRPRRHRLLRRPRTHLTEIERLHRIRQHRYGRKFTLALLIFAALKSSAFSAPLLRRPTWKVPIFPSLTISPLDRVASTISSSSAFSTATTSAECTVQAFSTRVEISSSPTSPLLPVPGHNTWRDHPSSACSCAPLPNT